MRTFIGLLLFLFAACSVVLAGQIVDMTNDTVLVGTPATDSEAANKLYVDSALGVRGATNVDYSACPAITSSSYNASARTFTLAGPAAGGGAGNQTPWTNNVDAATYNLTITNGVYLYYANTTNYVWLYAPVVGDAQILSCSNGAISTNHNYLW